MQNMHLQYTYLYQIMPEGSVFATNNCLIKLLYRLKILVKPVCVCMFMTIIHDVRLPAWDSTMEGLVERPVGHTLLYTDNSSVLGSSLSILVFSA